jgi:hypothetical protein
MEALWYATLVEESTLVGGVTGTVGMACTLVSCPAGRKASRRAARGRVGGAACCRSPAPCSLDCGLRKAWCSAASSLRRSRPRYVWPQLVGGMSLEEWCM